MNIPMKGKKDWTKEEWLAYKAEAEMWRDMDLSLNGNHIIECPHCGHEHYRVIKRGKVTSDRWQSSGGVYYYASTSAYYGDSTSANSTNASGYYFYSTG